MEGLAVDAQKLIDSSVKQLGERTTKLNDIGIQSNAQGQEGALEFKKLDAEKEFAGLVFQTESRRIALLQQEATISQQMLQIQIEALALKQQQEEDPVKKAALGLELQKATIDAAKQAEQTEIRITEEKRRQSLQGQIADTLMRAPGALGNALASGVMTGKNIGQQISNAVKGIGQQLLGEVFTHAIKQLVSTILANTLAQSIMHALFGTSIGVQATNTAALAANTTAMVATTTASVTAMGVLTATMATLTAALYFDAASNFLGFADGGDPPVGVPSIVGERGPELFIPKQAGVIIPNGALRSLATTGGSGMASVSSSSNFGHTFNGDIHLNGVQNVRDMMRQIANVAKTASPQFSPAASR
jgi:hypothetical protein